MTEKRLLPVSGKKMVKVFRKIGFQVDRQPYRNVKKGRHFSNS